MSKALVRAAAVAAPRVVGEGRAFDPSRGLRLFRDPRVATAVKARAGLLGVAGMLLLQAIEFPMETILAASFGPVGLAVSAVSDAFEMALIPLAIGAAALSRMVPPEP